jgi:hypothetical protein
MMARRGCVRSRRSASAGRGGIPGTQRGGTRGKRVVESVTHLADAKLITALRLGEKVDNLPHATLILAEASSQAIIDVRCRFIII